ncbi:MAG TPA: mechanosensitive ion channel family protein [Prochlorococcaceae cyanobacterium Fu_MAG_50]|nr:mechanosensitive ion channel family protein [Prochlorococcaceae cyanobacterium Fu_MAG_50]
MFGLRLSATVLVILLLVVLRQRSLLRAGLPKPPLRLPVLALLVWLATALPLLVDWFSVKQALLATIGHLALLYAILSLGGWILLEIPGALGWWQTPPKILRELCVLIAAAALTVIILQQAGVNLAGLITTSALLTAVVGFAAQEPLKDIFGGLSLQFDQPIKEGDWIQIGDDSGQVITLTLMNTYLRSAIDGCTLIIPNDTVCQATVRRMQPKSPYGNYFEVGLDYGFPPSQAISLLLDVVNRHSCVLAKPAPKVWVASFEDSAISYGLQVWHQDLGEIERKRIRGELLEQIWYALARVGQSIPFPVRTLSRKKQIISKNDPMSADDQRKLNWLSNNVLFCDLNQAQIETLAPSTRCIRFAKGETVIRQGEDDDCFFQVIAGMVEIFQSDADGHEHTLAKLGQNQIFGEMAICTNQPRSASARTMEESVLLEVERRDLQPLIDQDQSLLEKLARVVHHRQTENLKSKQELDSSVAISENRLIRSMQKLYNVFRGN